MDPTNTHRCPNDAPIHTVRVPPVRGNGQRTRKIQLRQGISYMCMDFCKPDVREPRHHISRHSSLFLQPPPQPFVKHTAVHTKPNYRSPHTSNHSSGRSFTHQMEQALPQVGRRMMPQGQRTLWPFAPASPAPSSSSATMQTLYNQTTVRGVDIEKR